jgi:poly(A) polymerase
VSNKRVIDFVNMLLAYPAALVAALSRLDSSCGGLFLAGGTVRDWLIDRPCADLDLVVGANAESCCRMLRVELGGGALVPLGEPENDTARLVWRGLTIDISGYRGGAATIEEDLRRRDFTVNAMAVSLRDLVGDAEKPVLIDPMGGLGDLQKGVLRACDRAFVDDPLRMLRGFRFCATLGCSFDATALEEIKASAPLIAKPAAERINHEMDLIMGSERAGKAFAAMAETGILWHIIPELKAGLGLVQPGFHHLDVFSHSLEALGCMEEILRQPEDYYAGCASVFPSYIKDERIRLKWASLLHDLGKPATMEKHPDEAGRITFYNHDRIGRDIFYVLAKRLRWSNEAKGRVGRLIELHMYPFHLCNASRSAGLGKRACLRIWKKAGRDLPGIFLLAMADSLACRGERKPEDMEDELAVLFRKLLATIERSIKPVLSRPKLVTGNDLIDRFHLTPGPVFSRVLAELETARVEGKIHDRQEALDWIAKYLQNREMPKDGL